MSNLWVSEHSDLLITYPDLTKLVWKQISKDFSMENLDFVEGSPITLDEIYNELYPIVSSLINNAFTDLMRLLYRIDISELCVKKGMDKFPNDTSRAISTLILKREIEKVVTRKRFS